MRFVWFLQYQVVGIVLSFLIVLIYSIEIGYAAIIMIFHLYDTSSRHECYICHCNCRPEMGIQGADGHIYRGQPRHGVGHNYYQLPYRFTTRIAVIACLPFNFIYMNIEYYHNFIKHCFQRSLSKHTVRISVVE